ncbi:hypothetical protein YC2023_059727 [Brassica napus]
MISLQFCRINLNNPEWYASLNYKEDRAATSGEQSASSNFQINGSTVFRLGNTTSSGYTGTSRSKRIDRKRPPAWVRRVRTNRYGAGAIAVSQGHQKEKVTEMTFING